MIHKLNLETKNLQGSFNKAYEPILTINSGDSIQLKTLDIQWGYSRRKELCLKRVIMKKTNSPNGRRDGGLKVIPDHPRSTFCEDDEGELSQFLQQYMHRHGQLKQGEPCMYTLTPDEDFIIDLHPTYPHVAIVAGFSGHGFKFSGVVGSY